MSSPLISIIDDDVSVRISLEGLIRSLGYLVVSFSSAEDFLESPSVLRSVCLILDVQMPGYSGLDLQKRLLEQEINLPIIFITAFPDPTMRARAVTAGALAFLSKPFNVCTMVNLIEHVISGSPTNDVNQGINS